MRPEITVIVPYRNERETIEFTLARVGEQTLAPKAAIFVNSSSTDDTPQIVDAWIGENRQRFPTRFLNLFEHTDNPASSKNVGIRRADTEWVAFMDCGQNFAKRWLEQQFQCASDRGLDVVSGVVYLVGENWVDRCAVAQTYGYRRNRPCIPTTLAKRTVFDAAGLFLEGRRAHYDAVWAARLKRLGIERGINESVCIQYIGVNFASNLSVLYKKSVAYAAPAVAIEEYWTPYVYALGSLLYVLVLAVSIEAATAIFLLYFVVRTFVLPVLKSRGIAYYREHPVEALLGLGIVGALLDIGRTVGTWKGIGQYHFARSSAGKAR